MSLNYNYIVFNVVESKMKLNPNGYYTICLRDLDSTDGVLPIYYPLQHKGVLTRTLYNMHTSRKINSIVRLPFKNLWYSSLFKDDFKEDKPKCFILLERMPIDYCKYLKRKYPDCKIVLVYRDLRKITEMMYPSHPDNHVFDMQASIDARESQKYGWLHFDEFESQITVPVAENYPQSDVFFAGKVKDRLPRLLRAYDILSKAGLKVSYYLTGVPKNEQTPLEGVVYADSFMNYSEMLFHTVNTRCVLEINQAEAVGYTSRFLEAVMFNKRLITDNKDVMKSKFYTDGNILCISDIDDIYPEFVVNNTLVDYKYNNEFSPIHFIKKVDVELMKRYGC